jgi:hypothetical protein
MVKCGVLFEVRAEFLNITYTNFGFKGLSLVGLVSVGLLLVYYFKVRLGGVTRGR